jgi:hypothetical protein
MRWMAQYVAASQAAPHEAARSQRSEKRRVRLGPLFAQLRLPHASRRACAAGYEPCPIHSSPPS